MLKKERDSEAVARSEIEDMEILREERGLSEEEKWIMSENTRLVQEIEENRTRDLRQRSRVKWAKDGDENSKFFHSIINSRKDKFKEELSFRHAVICDNIKRINPEEASSLVAGFSSAEIKAAVSDYGSDRAPGPDGLNFKFLKHFWDIFYSDFVQVLNEFHSSGSVLSSRLIKVFEIGAVAGVRLPNSGPSLSHLLFADDALIIGEWSEESILNVVRILKGFHICSGLRINLAKSNIYCIGVSISELDSMASMVGCKSGQLPLKYLELLVRANMKRTANWRSVFELFESRLSLWKVAVLSIGERVTLIKSVIECLPNYFLSLYKAPVGVLKQLESIIRRFQWGGTGNLNKLSWVSWERVASLIDCGGLGSINTSLLLKWAWRFKTNKDSLWVKVISAIHASKRSGDFLPVKVSLGGVWGNIVKLGIIGDGKDVAFYLDPWLDRGPLKFRYLNLYELELDKNCVVRNRIIRPVSNPDASWKWKRPPDSSVELAEWSALCSQLRDVDLSDARDKWRCEGEESGEFSVGSVKRLLASNIDSNERFVCEWCKWVPLKWEETAMHLFTSCSLAMSIRSKVSIWCKVPFLVAFSFKDILEAHWFSGLKGKDQAAYQGIVIIACWLIWKARNKRVFSVKVPKADEIFCSIKLLGYLWFRDRSKCIDVSWETLCNFV
ncbi:uncharacterized protein LOC110901940 [Helianthus annuus]|uniref:uncharacterized protein LOC110901940 n=1 Tax=Helianthus annuus TaxID=4232 RepID=UPI000B8F7222|nr:uncharacterized protein LOC110901940 [Helianthus annuus]